MTVAMVNKTSFKCDSDIRTSFPQTGYQFATTHLIVNVRHDFSR